MSTSTILYLSRQDVESLDFSMREIIDAVEAMFSEKGEGRVEMPPKPGIHTRPDAFIHAMPAYIPSLEAAGVKWISGYPGNQQKQLPYITGLLLLNDPDTGLPTAVMDATWITAQRTGAATAVAAKHLARPDSSSAGIIACGVQGRSNLEALSCIFPISSVKAYDMHRQVADQFAADMAPIVGAEIEVVATPEQAVVDLDLVVTSGPILKHPQPVIEADWLAPGAFASPVDFDSYWQGPALQQADKLATDDLAQMDYYRSEGYFGETPQPYADLGEIVAGRKPGRERDDERTISVNLGIALEDMATAIRIYRRAVETGAGTQLPL
ncbi:MAG: ornithine cyclodeaminase family protein [Lentisphaeria bacterium]|jgi:ornithine cyclodeaminase/alanine dehydrogenase|nr:ornithine cyclodeaminase family protein [Lentisphaeria bacterium]